MRTARLWLLRLIYEQQEDICKITEFEKLDKDKNGQIDKGEFQALELEDRRLKIQDPDEKRNTERLLVKACCAGMLLYPFIILLASVLGFETAASLITDIASLYVLAASGVVVGYFGFNSIREKNS